ncbi:hypothetical protein [Listeria fleischmannii]|uniref:Uncharacterized protein n=1 Tax=Listeria fleischmannii FSL S10-1203 TaxID=1265822 RepID=W7E2B2_9LIST|nr:hypothetical protein [Listeria fleischmannii]EUJ64743.1 hypothetical protein MCOL2_00975 [Listeria fleischmannii FSL S10-1203]
MRYPDINPKTDALFQNVTTTSPLVKGLFAPDSSMYIRKNDDRRIKLLTDVCGVFERRFESVEIGDIITFEFKEGTQYIKFADDEKIRE